MNLTQNLFSAAWRPELFGSLVQDIDPDLIPGADNSVPTALLNAAATGAAGNYGTIVGTPKLKRNSQNGHSTILFDGVGDEAITTFNTPPGARTDFLVFKTVTNPTVGNTAVVNLDITATPDHCKILFLRNAVVTTQPYEFGAKAVNDVVAAVGIADALDTNAHILSITYNNGNRNEAASYIVTLDGVSKTVLQSGANTVPTTYLSTIGAIDTGVSGPLAAWNGHFIRKLVFNTNLSTQQRAAVQQNLHLLYGI